MFFDIYGNIIASLGMGADIEKSSFFCLHVSNVFAGINTVLASTNIMV